MSHTPLSACRGAVSSTLVALLAAGLLVGSGADHSVAAPAYATAWQRQTPGHHGSSAAVADLPGGRAVLAADLSGTLRALRADGSLVWQVGVDPFPGRPSAMESSPAVGDLDGDGVDDIVVGAGAIDPRSRRDHGGVVAYDGLGRVKWRFRTRDTLNVYTGGPPDGLSDGVTTTPVIGDVDGDGINDVVFGSLDHYVYALRGTDGALLPGFPYDNMDTIFSSAALVDIDADPALEILVGGDATINPPAGWFARGTFRALDVVPGGVRQAWLRTFGDIVMSSPAVGDVDGDGQLEAVFSTGGFYDDSPDSRRVWAVRVRDGGNTPGWPHTLDALVRTSPALGDVVPGDGGRPEVVLGDRDGAVYALRGNGTRAWKTFPGAVSSGGRGNNGNGYDGGATISDLDGDGDQDVAMPYGLGGALLVDGRSGALQRMVGGVHNATIGAPAVVDFGGSQGRQMVLLGWQPGVPEFATGAITAVQLPPTTAPPAWPLFRKDARRLGAPVSPREGESSDYVRALYADMLGRAPAPRELQGWSRAVSGDRWTGALGLAESEEYRRRTISAVYRDVLGRPAEPGGVDSWVRELAARRTTLDDLPRRFMLSDEFYFRGGGTDQGFVDLLYRRALNRPANLDERRLWAQTVARQGRAEAVRGIYDSRESALQRVGRSYSRWLARPASAEERSYWASTVIVVGDERMRASAMVSPEYLARARARY